MFLESKASTVVAFVKKKLVTGYGLSMALLCDSSLSSCGVDDSIGWKNVRRRSIWKDGTGNATVNRDLESVPYERKATSTITCAQQPNHCPSRTDPTDRAVVPRQRW